MLRRVLIVDDDAQARTALRRTLEREGREILEAGDGEQALGIARAQRPDCVLTDLRMPRMDGHTLVRRLARSNADASIVVLSSSDSSEDILDALRAGAVDFLVKPFTISDLTAALQRATARHGGGGGGGGGAVTPAAAPPAPVARAIVPPPPPTTPLLERMNAAATAFPKVPAVLARLRTLLAAADPSLADIATLVEREPAVAARTLRLANSAQQAGRGGAITGIHAAVARVGLRQLRNLVEAACLADAARARSAAGAAIQAQIWRTSVARAESMRALLEQMQPRGAPMLPEPAYAAGLFADAGALFMVTLFSEDELAREAQAVRQAIIVHHERIGADLVRAWGLTSLDAAVAAAHHVTSAASPAGAAFGGDLERSASECFLALSSSLASELVGPDYTDGAPPERAVIDECAAVLNVGVGAAAAVVEKVAARLSEVEAIFHAAS